MTRQDIIIEYLQLHHKNFNTSDNQGYYIEQTKKQFENNCNPFSLTGMHMFYTDNQVESLETKSKIWEQYRQKYNECTKVV